jgi:hypothetical protein
MAVLPGSPAIVGVPANTPGAPATDQRGFSRNTAAATDIGAFEVQPTDSTAALTASPGPSVYGPDGRLLAGIHRLVGTFPGHEGTVLSVAFSADGGRLVAGGTDSLIRVWDVVSKDCLLTLSGHAHEVFAAIFHPDGSRIASGGRDRLVRLWDAATGEELARLPGHSDYVYSLAFSPDGKALVSGSGDTTLRLWDIEPLRIRSPVRRAAEVPRPNAQGPIGRLRASVTSTCARKPRCPARRGPTRRSKLGRSRRARLRFGGPLFGARVSPSCVQKRPTRSVAHDEGARLSARCRAGRVVAPADSARDTKGCMTGDGPWETFQPMPQASC